MFERWTERARQVIVLAQEEARNLRQDHIGTEHILLGLLREEEGLGARVLEHFDITIEKVRADVVSIVGGPTGRAEPVGQIAFTPRVKKVIEFALREALALAHNFIGTEHILLALIREGEGVAAHVLLDYDLTPDEIRNETIRMLSGPSPQDAPPVEREFVIVPAHAMHTIRATSEALALQEHLARRAALGHAPDENEDGEWVVLQLMTPGRKLRARRSTSYETIDLGEAR